MTEKSKEILGTEENANKGVRSEDYSNLLEKIRQQVNEEENTPAVNENTVQEEVKKDKFIDTVTFDRQELAKELERVNEKSKAPEKIQEFTQEKNKEFKEAISQKEQEEENNVVLEVLGLKKRIGLKTIVEDITFDMHSGEIIGLLGPNGSGKTTTMRMMVGLTKATKGDVYCFEKPLGIGKTKMLKEVGAMIEAPEFYNYMSGWSNLKQMARVCGKKVTRTRMKELVEFVGLKDAIHKKVKTYSLGMRQRLGLAQALLNDPKVLILDEPVNGLDPQGVQDFRNKLKEIAATGVSILISSHLLDEIEKVCDRIIVLEKGRIIADDKLENLVTDEVVRTLVSVYDVQKAHVLIEELAIAYELVDNGFIFKNISREDKSRVVTYLVTNNVEIDSISELSTSLEDRFLQITGGEGK